MAAVPIVFVNIGWMIDYAGVSAEDPTLGGHGYLRNNISGHEAWNFAPYGKHVYGYVPGSASIKLQNLGGSANDDHISPVTVVWIARNPRDKQTYIVGWYQNATVYRNRDQIELKRQSGFRIGYQIVAPAEQAHLLPPPSRLFHIPTAKIKGNLGQSPVWYGGTDAFRSKVSAYVDAGGSFPKSPTNRGASKRQQDPEARKKVELAAVRHATAFYESAEGGNQTVASVEKDGVGWDLVVTASTGAILKVEVKGLSGRDLVVELTPNEYKQMIAAENRSEYVVYIVTEAGTREARSHVFNHNKETSKGRDLIWSTDDGRILNIDQRVAARLSAPFDRK